MSLLINQCRLLPADDWRKFMDSQSPDTFSDRHVSRVIEVFWASLEARKLRLGLKSNPPTFFVIEWQETADTEKPNPTLLDMDVRTDVPIRKWELSDGKATEVKLPAGSPKGETNMIKIVPMGMDMSSICVWVSLDDYYFVAKEEDHHFTCWVCDEWRAFEVLLASLV